MADVYEDEISGNAVVLPHLVDWTSYTPTFTAPVGVAANVDIRYLESLTSLSLIGTFTTGTVDNGAVRFTLPNAYTAVKTLVVGTWWCYSNSNTAKKRGTLYSTAGSNEIRFGIDEKTELKAPFSDEPTRADLGFFSTQQINIKIENLQITQLQALGPYRAYGAGRANSIRDGLSAPRGDQTTQTVTSNMPGWTPIRTTLEYYQTQNNVHRLKFHISGAFTTKALTGSDSVSIPGVVFRNQSFLEQTCAGSNTGSSPVSAGIAVVNTGSISIISNGSTNASRVAISGDFELDAKPTWA